MRISRDFWGFGGFHGACSPAVHAQYVTYHTLVRVRSFHLEQLKINFLFLFPANYENLLKKICPRGQIFCKIVVIFARHFLKNNLAFTLIFFENRGLFPRKSFGENVFSAGIAGAPNRVLWGAKNRENPRQNPYFR